MSRLELYRSLDAEEGGSILGDIIGRVTDVFMSSFDRGAMRIRDIDATS